MKHALALFLVWVLVPLHAANFPTEYQSALRLYVSNKFNEAKDAFAVLIASAPNAETKDAALAQATYCAVQLKDIEAAEKLAAGIKDKFVAKLCRMNVLTLQAKYREVVALVEDEDFSLWPDALIFEALMSRGNALSRFKKVTAAEKDFRAALDYTLNDYKKATAHLRLGGLFKGQEALDCYDEVMKLKEPGPTLRYQAVAARARLLAADGKGVQALAEFDRLNDLTKQPHWTMVQMARAATHEALNEPDKARACYEGIVASSNPPADSLATAKAKLQAEEAKIATSALALVQKIELKPSDTDQIKELPLETKLHVGKLFDDNIVALVSFYDLPPKEEEFYYPPCHLAILQWSGTKWNFKQYVGTASKFDVRGRKDLGLIVVQGWCRTERNGGQQASWRWDSKSRRLVATDLDDWGPYSIKGDYICYTRGTERLAHWDTHWIYRFADGKRGELVAVYHEVDTGGWTVSFRRNSTETTLTHWAFVPDRETASTVHVRSAEEDDDIGGDEIAEIKLPKGQDLEPSYCFEILTGLPSKLILDNGWIECLPKANPGKVPKMVITGEPDVRQKLQPSQPK